MRVKRKELPQSSSSSSSSSASSSNDSSSESEDSTAVKVKRPISLLGDIQIDIALSNVNKKRVKKHPSNKVSTSKKTTKNAKSTSQLASKPDKSKKKKDVPSVKSKPVTQRVKNLRTTVDDAPTDSSDEFSSASSESDADNSTSGSEYDRDELSNSHIKKRPASKKTTVKKDTKKKPSSLKKSKGKSYVDDIAQKGIRQKTDLGKQTPKSNKQSSQRQPKMSRSASSSQNGGSTSAQSSSKTDEKAIPGDIPNSTRQYLNNIFVNSDKRKQRIIIVGGGIIGASCAYYLNRDFSDRIKEIIVVEQDRIASGASGRAGGFIAKEWQKNTATSDLAKFSWDLHLELNRTIREMELQRASPDTKVSVVKMEEGESGTLASRAVVSKGQAFVNNKNQVITLDSFIEKDTGKINYGFRRVNTWGATVELDGLDNWVESHFKEIENEKGNPNGPANKSRPTSKEEPLDEFLDSNYAGYKPEREPKWTHGCRKLSILGTKENTAQCTPKRLTELLIHLSGASIINKECCGLIFDTNYCRKRFKNDPKRRETVMAKAKIRGRTAKIRSANSSLSHAGDNEGGDEDDDDDVVAINDDDDDIISIASGSNDVDARDINFNDIDHSAIFELPKVCGVKLRVSHRDGKMSDAELQAYVEDFLKQGKGNDEIRVKNEDGSEPLDTKTGTSLEVLYGDIVLLCMGPWSYRIVEEWGIPGLPVIKGMKAHSVYLTPDYLKINDLYKTTMEETEVGADCIFGHLVKSSSTIEQKVDHSRSIDRDGKVKKETKGKKVCSSSNTVAEVIDDSSDSDVEVTEIVDSRSRVLYTKQTFKQDWIIKERKEKRDEDWAPVKQEFTASGLPLPTATSELATTQTNQEFEIYPRPDGTIYICGYTEGDQYPEDPGKVRPTPGKCEHLYKVASRISCTMARACVNIQRSQACYLPVITDIAPGGTSNPAMGRVPKTLDLFIASGHSCWGIHNSLGTGKAMSEVIMNGECSSLDLSLMDPSRNVLQELDVTKSRY